MTINSNNLRYLQLGKFFPPNWGGIETVTANLLSGFTSKGIANSALVFGNDDSVNELNYGKFKAYLYTAKSTKLFGKPFSFSYIYLFFRLARNFDVVIVHLPNPIAIFCLLLSGYKGCVALYWHSDIVNKGILGTIVIPLERWLLKRADVIVAPTSAHLQFSRYAELLIKKSHVVPYLIDQRLLSIAKSHKAIARSISGKSLIRIIAIGRLVEYKGLEYLIRAIPIILLRVQCRLDIVGQGPLENKFKSLVSELSIEEYVFIRGQLANDEREELLESADIFCFPSVTKAEMYGMAQIEAMAHGLPIISTNIYGSGAPELTKMAGAGIVVPTHSVNDIAAAINFLVDNPDLYSEFSKSGIDSIINIFNPDIIIKKFCSIFEGK
jgi:glycosyltransferase involved in cell wall biosynthesis